MKVPGHVDRELLAHAVLVPAHVGDDERVGGSGAAQLAQDALGPQRILRRAPLVGPVRGEFLAAARDLLGEAAAIGVTLAARFVGEGRERQLRIRAHAQLGLVVAPELGEIGVDVNQAGRRNREGEARIPRARVRLGEPRADRRRSGRRCGTSRSRSACPRIPTDRAAADARAGGSPCPSACARPAPAALRRAPAVPSSRARTGRRRRRTGPAGARWPAHRRCGQPSPDRDPTSRSPAASSQTRRPRDPPRRCPSARRRAPARAGRSAPGERRARRCAADRGRCRRDRRACRTAGRSGIDPRPGAGSLPGADGVRSSSSGCRRRSPPSGSSRAPRWRRRWRRWSGPDRDASSGRRPCPTRARSRRRRARRSVRDASR